MNLNIHVETYFERITLGCGVLLCSIGGLGFIGWALNFRILTGIRLDYISITPDTALIVILFGVALFSATAWHSNQRIRDVIAGISACALVIVSPILLGMVIGVDLNIDYIWCIRRVLRHRLERS